MAENVLPSLWVRNASFCVKKERLTAEIQEFGCTVKQSEGELSPWWWVAGWGETGLTLKLFLARLHPFPFASCTCRQWIRTLVGPPAVATFLVPFKVLRMLDVFTPSIVPPRKQSPLFWRFPPESLCSLPPPNRDVSPPPACSEMTVLTDFWQTAEAVLSSADKVVGKHRCRILKERRRGAFWHAGPAMEGKQRNPARTHTCTCKPTAREQRRHAVTRCDSAVCGRNESLDSAPQSPGMIISPKCEIL